MVPKYTATFQKAYKNLQVAQQKKFQRIEKLILENPRHPSLRSRKESGSDIYEARLDRHYRITYVTSNNEIHFLLVGPHDVGLGKK